MKLFLDTAQYEQIKKWAETGLIDGITSNPSLLSKEHTHPKELLKKIATLFPHGDVSIQVTEENPEAVYKQAKEIAELGANIVVKIPCQVRYYPIIKKLVDEGIPLNITLVFSLLQGLWMSKLGVKFISPFIGRLDDIDMNGIELIPELRLMIDDYGYKTQILAASIRTVRDVHEAVLAGADAITIPVSILEKAVEHPLTDRGIELFHEDWKKLGISKFP